MKPTLPGVPAIGGTPFFLIALLLMASMAWAAPETPRREKPRSPERPAVAAPASGAPAGATTTAAASTAKKDQVRLFADYMSFAEGGGEVTAKGNVRVWYGNATLTAESADANLQTEVIHARGNVTLTEAGRQLKSDALEYNLKTKNALAEGIVFASFPWYYQGRSVEKIGEKTVQVNDSSFTTCNARHPHFHITASQIDIELGESLTAYNATVYVGSTPVFYFPWFRRSIKDNRPPFSVRVGYNDFEGLYTKIRFNYFLLEGNYGSLLLDVMQKKGLGYGLEQHVQYELLGKGQGLFSVLYAQDKVENRQRWTALAQNTHDITDQDQIQLRADYVSDSTFNREYSYNLVDNFQQKSFLTYSRRTNDYYLSILAQDIETWEPPRVPGQEGQYISSLRELPSLNFSLNQQRIGRIWQPLYFGLTGSAVRYRDLFQDAYVDRGAITPTLTETLALPRWITQPSISGSLSLPITGMAQEWDATKQFLVSYSTNLSLTNKWVNYVKSKPTHLMQTRLSYDFSRALPTPDSRNLQDAGVTTNHLGLFLDYFLGTNWSLQSSTGYSFLWKREMQADGTILDNSKVRDWRKQLDPFTLTGRGSWERFSINWQGTYDYSKARITMGNVNANLNSSKWNLGFNTSYFYRPGDPRGENAVLGTLNAGYNFGIGLSAHTNLQYDFNQRELTRYSVTLNRDLHCWAMTLGYTQYADGHNEIGFGINLKAFPEVRIGSGGNEFAVGQ